MDDWTEGYVSDVQYTAGFYREMAPSHLAFIALVMGYALGPVAKPKHYLELASGQGFGTVLLAATNPQTEFVGIDFNPGQTANARKLAEEAGLTNVRFLDWSFQETATRTEGLPREFDIIALHGIYSWVSEENRKAIVTILRQRLRPGGFAYVSYNSLPGWAPVAPAQRLIREFADRNPGRSDQQIAEALRFLNSLRDGKAFYFSLNPIVEKRLETITKQDPHYLAHEYLNAHWHPLYFSEVARELNEARLSFVGSATLTENINNLSVPPGLRDLLQNTVDPIWAEVLRDYVANKQFRRDIFGRGTNKLSPIEKQRDLLQMRLALIVPLSNVKLTFKGPLGDYEGAKDIYRPIVEMLDRSPATLAELTAQPALRKAGVLGVLQALASLVSSGQVSPTNALETGEHRAAHRFNQMVIQELKVGRTFKFLAAPAAGTGIPVSTQDLFALAAVLDGKQKAADAARHALDIMQSLGQRPRKDGKVLTEGEAVAYIEELIKPILTDKLPLWKRLGVLPS